MYDNLTAFEKWVISLSPESIVLLVVAKQLSDGLVLAVVVIPCIVALFRPMRFLWLTTRLRAAILLTASAIWITAWFWIDGANEAVRTIRTIGPVEMPGPPPPPSSIPTEYLRR